MKKKETRIWEGGKELKISANNPHSSFKTDKRSRENVRVSVCGMSWSLPADPTLGALKTLTADYPAD